MSQKSRKSKSASSLEQEKVERKKRRGTRLTLLDGRQRLARSNDEPERRSLLGRVVRSDHGLIVLSGSVLVGVSVEGDSKSERFGSGVSSLVSLVDGVGDLDRRVGVDELGDVSPARREGREREVSERRGGKETRRGERRTNICLVSSRRRSFLCSSSSSVMS